MTGSEIVQIISLVLTAVVSIVTLLVRARIIGLEGEVKKLNEVLVKANQMIIDQGRIITQLSQQLTMETEKPKRKEKPQDYQGFPPYRQEDR